MSKKKSYIGIAFIILLFGIYTVPKIVDRFKDSGLAYLKTSGSSSTKRKVPQFSFVNQEEQTITNDSYKGKVYVVEFFFTTCPSICPIMTDKMLQLQDAFLLNPDFGIASISITPNIDSPEILKEYAKNKGITHKNWHLLTGRTEDFVYDIAKSGFSLYAGKGDKDHGGFEHSGYFALVDKEGFLRSRIDGNGNPIIYYNAIENEGFPDQINELKQDIKLLLDE